MADTKTIEESGIMFARYLNEKRKMGPFLTLPIDVVFMRVGDFVKDSRYTEFATKEFCIAIRDVYLSHNVIPQTTSDVVFFNRWVNSHFD